MSIDTDTHTLDTETDAHIVLYHNPRCSKSRQTLALLQSRDIEPTVVHYLETPPTADALSEILRKLDVTPRELLRTKEAAYQELDLANPERSDAEIIAAMVNHPILIERPIVVTPTAAAIGRPPENVERIL